MSDIKFTEKRPKHAEHAYGARKFSMTDTREAHMQYTVNGVGVDILGKPNVLANKVELIIARYSADKPSDPVEHRAFIHLNQLIRLELETANASERRVIEGEMAQFCTDKLSSFFVDNHTAFDDLSMSASLHHDPEVTVICCAALDAPLRQSIYRKALHLEVPYLTNEQRDFALEANTLSSTHNHKSSSPKHRVDLGSRATTASYTGLNRNNLKTRVTVSRHEANGCTTYIFAQPTPEGKRHQTEPSEVVIQAQIKPLSGGRRSVTLSQPGRKGNWPFARIVLPESDNDANANNVNQSNVNQKNTNQEASLIAKLGEAVNASLTEGGYFKRNPFVRDSLDMYVSGFDQELKARLPETVITRSAKLSMADQPVAFILIALNALRIIDVQVVKSDSQDQKVYALQGADRLNLVTVCAESVAANQWGDRSPLQWLVPNGKIRPNNSSRLIESLVKHGVIDIKRYHGNQIQAIKAISEAVLAYIGHPENVSMRLGHTMNDGRGTVLKRIPPLPTPTNDPTLLAKFEGYLRDRGITQSVIDRAKSQNIIYTSLDEKHCPAVSMLAFDNFGDVTKPVVQKFVPSPDGKWTKMFVKGAPAGGAAHIIQADYEQYVVLCEANIDMYAFLSAIELAGGNMRMYSAHSLMSAGYIPAWFENAFSLRLPKDENDGHGYLIEKTYAIRNHDALLDDLSRFFEKYTSIQFIDDGKPASKKSLRFFNQVVAFAGVEKEKISIQSSENRVTKIPLENELVFDRTCFERTMASAGLSCNDQGDFVYTHEHVHYTKIVTDAQKAEAKRRITEKVGDAKFILAFDNDLAGHSKAVALHRFFKMVGIPAHPVVVPYESKADMAFSEAHVVSRVLNEEDPSTFDFNAFLLLNDMNDLLKKMLGVREERQRLLNTFRDQVKGRVDGDQLLSDSHRIAKALDTQKKRMENTYADLFEAAKGLEAHRKQYGIASEKGRAAVKIWEADKAKRIQKLNAMLSDEKIPLAHRRYLSMSPKIQRH